MLKNTQKNTSNHKFLLPFSIYLKKLLVIVLTSCSPALYRPSPIGPGVLFPDPPVALSGPGGDWMYSVPEPGVSAALPDGYMGAYSW